MIRKLRPHMILTLALAAGAAFPAYADCTYPRAPASMPNGNTASMEEMVEGQKQVKQYMADMDTYLKCLDEGKSAPPERSRMTAFQVEPDSNQTSRMSPPLRRSAVVTAPERNAAGAWGSDAGV